MYSGGGWAEKVVPEAVHSMGTHLPLLLPLFLPLLLTGLVAMPA